MARNVLLTDVLLGDALPTKLLQPEGKAAMKKPPAIAGGDVVPQGEAMD
jgi:hypothetical protein